MGAGAVRAGRSRHSVAEVACAVPGCRPIETVIAFWLGERRHHFKVFEPVAEAVEDDLPPRWYMGALAVPTISSASAAESERPAHGGRFSKRIQPKANRSPALCCLCLAGDPLRRRRNERDGRGRDQGRGNHGLNLRS